MAPRLPPKNSSAAIDTLLRVQEQCRHDNASKVVWRVGSLKALCRARCTATTTDPDTGLRHELLFLVSRSHPRDWAIGLESQP